jgi:hypothetical protein
MMKVLGLTTSVALVSMAFSCTGSDDGGGAEGGQGAPEMTVSLSQPRSAEGSRKVGIQVTNTGDTTFTIETVRLVWPRLPNAPASPAGTEFPPGWTLDLFTYYGDPDCSDYPSPSASPAAAELRFADTGVTVTRRLDAHGQAWLDRLYAAECEEAALRDAAQVRLSDTWTRIEVGGKPYLRGWIALDRAGGVEPVTVTSVFGSVLLSFNPMRPGRPVAVLTSRQTALRIPVRIGSSNRCDKHALSGSTQTYLLSVFVRRGDAPVQRLILVPDARTRDRILHVVHDACQI